MADFGGVNIQTPQEVLARLQAQRDQFRQSQDPQVRRQASYDQALDALFGNPQLQAAKRTTDAIVKAQDAVQPQPGESDLDTELRRLQSMRNAVSDIDPAAASQINQQMLKLGAEKLERQKLQADMAYKQKESDRQDSELGMKKGEYAMKVGAYPTELAEKQASLDTKLAETQNYTNPKTGEMVNVGALDSIAIKQLQQAGWVKSGLNVQVDDPKKLAGPTKATTTDLQKSVISADNQLSALKGTIQKYDPKFLQLPTQILNSAINVGEKLGLPVEQSATRKQYYEFRRNAVDGLNRYINEITGAAIGVKEEERIREAFPDAYNDSATKFEAKMRETVRSVMGIRKRADQMLKSGISQVDRTEWDSIQPPPVSDAEVDAFMGATFGMPTKSSGSSAAPKSKARILSVTPVK